MAVAFNPVSVEFSVDEDDLANVNAASFGLNDAALNRASRRASNKVARWMRLRVQRFIAGYFKTAQKNIIPRVNVSPADKRGKGAYLWLGTNPIDPTRFYEPENISAGAMAGGWYFNRGFVATMPNGKTGIFMRRDKKRLKIDLQKVNIDDAVREYVSRLIGRAQKQLIKVFHQEINFEMQKAQGLL